MPIKILSLRSHAAVWHALGMRLFLSLFLLATTSAQANPELSVQWIRNQTEKGAYSIEALLERFQPESLERRLLAYHSESRQHATPLHPRVVVYNYDADFIFTFNGEPGSEGYHELEILEFDHEQSRFVPHLFEFDPQGKVPAKYIEHPKQCASCHHADIRPNWDPYFFWTGFYGSEDDDAFTGSSSWPERRQFQQFLAKQEEEKKRGQGRYRFLPPHPQKRLNLDFNDRVTCLNMKRMLRIFASSPLAGEILDKVGAYSRFTGTMPFGNLPPALEKRVKRRYPAVLVDTREKIQAAITRRLDLHKELTGEGPAGRAFNLLPNGSDLPDRLGDHAEFASYWRFIFEELMGISFRSIATSFHPDYDLNVDAWSNVQTLLAGATTKPDGSLELSHKRQPRAKDSTYLYYVCPRYGRFYDLPTE